VARKSPEVWSGEAAAAVEVLAADFEAEARAALERGARFTVAIPGGSVARSCFPRLAALALDWSRIEFFWTDERAAPPTSPDSNYSLARELWLEPLGVPAEHIHRMPGEASDLDQAARAYADELTKIAGKPPRLDYALLGVGSDGHVASLFPDHPALRDKRPVLAIENAPLPPARRLSLSLRVLADAARVVIVAFGTTKARVMGEIAKDLGSSLPVAQVARRARRCLILLDREAGSTV
jgi:6-phosphogluconolactonase